MNKFLLSALLIAIVNLFLLSPLNAQSQNLQGIGVSPAIQEVVVGNTYSFTVYNFSENSFTVEVEPTLIEYIITDDGSREAVLRNVELNYDDYIVLSKDTLQIAPGEEALLSLDYKQKVDTGTIGIKLKAIEGNSEGQILTLGAEAVAVIVDYSLSDTDVLGIVAELDASLASPIVGLSGNGEFNLTSKVDNKTTSFLKPSGQIEVFDGEIRLGIISLTQSFPTTIYPNEVFEVQNNFVDERSVFDQLGEIKFVQTLTFDGREVISEVTVFVFPFQVGLIAGGIGIVVLLMAVVFLKRRKRIK